MGIRILIPRPRRRLPGLRGRKFLWLAGGACVWGLAYSTFATTGLVGVYRADAEVARLEREVEQARQINAELRERAEALRSDPLTIEREARERLGLAKEGDTVYLLPAPSSDDRHEADEPERAATDAAAEPARRP